MHGCCLRGSPLRLDRSREVHLALAMRTLVPSPKPQGADTVSPGGSPVTESTFEQARRTALDADGSEEARSVAIRKLANSATAIAEAPRVLRPGDLTVSCDSGGRLGRTCGRRTGLGVGRPGSDTPGGRCFSFVAGRRFTTRT